MVEKGKLPIPGADDKDDEDTDLVLLELEIPDSFEVIEPPADVVDIPVEAVVLTIVLNVVEERPVVSVPKPVPLALILLD